MDMVFPAVEIQTTPTERPSVPPWFAETVILARHFLQQGLLEAIAQEVRLVRGRFGHYEVLDFVAVLLGYAVSGEATLEAFFARLAPCATAFMALFGRTRLPHRSTLSRFLAALDQPCLEALRHLFEQDLFCQQDGRGGLWDRIGQRWLLFDVDGTRQAARQRALPTTADLPAPRRRFRAVCAPGYLGDKRGEVVRTRTTVSQTHTHQWLGTFAGAGNGDYRADLGAACRVIVAFLQARQVPLDRAVVRLDGQYGDPAVLAQIAKSGLGFLVRGKDYHLLAHPQLQVRLQAPCDQELQHPESQVRYEVFEGGVILLEAVGLSCRVIITRRPVPPDSKPVGVGKRMGEWVYELFLTSLPLPALLTVDVLTLYHQRGAFEMLYADEDREQDSDRWCSRTPRGQEFWQVLCQWVWNLRLEWGQVAQPENLHWTELAPAQENAALPVVASPEVLEQEYGPLEMASDAGRGRGRFAGRDFTPQEPDTTLRCPAGKTLTLQEQRTERYGTLRLVFWAPEEECAICPLRAQCLGRKASGRRSRRVSALRRLRVKPPALPLPAQAVAVPAVLWADLPRRAVRWRWLSVLRCQQVTLVPLAQPPPTPRPPIWSRRQRAHWRLSWSERLARNACPATHPPVQITLFGLPPPVAQALDLPSLPAGS